MGQREMLGAWLWVLGARGRRHRVGLEVGKLRNWEDVNIRIPSITDNRNEALNRETIDVDLGKDFEDAIF